MSELDDDVTRLRAEAAACVPGRVAELIEQRVLQLHGLDAAQLPSDLAAGERVALDVAEQFVVDVHGLTDAQVAAMSGYFSDAERLAIMFHLSLVDGFAKLRRLDRT